MTTPVAIVLALSLTVAFVGWCQVWRCRAWLRQNGLRLRAEQESEHAIISRFQAVKERERAEYEELLKSCGAAVLVLDSKQTVLLANDSARQCCTDRSDPSSGGACFKSHSP